MIRSIQRKAIESMYVGVCNVIERQAVTDPITKITRHEEVTVLRDQPCRLSFQSIPATNQTDTVAQAAQTIKLFIAPEIDIKAGSKLIVTQHGRTEEYARSGKPAIYGSHQEVQLELFKGYT